MSTDNNNVQAAAPHALQDFTSCPDWGKGGQFIYDPATKTRTRVEPEAAAPEAAVQAPAEQAQDTAPAETSTTTRKERKGA